MSDFHNITEFCDSTQLSEIWWSNLNPSRQCAFVSGLMVETLSSVVESNLCVTLKAKLQVARVAG